MQVRVLEFLADNTKGKPMEDHLLWTADSLLARYAFAVADGVTRFVPEGSNYPDPSAWHAANIFCSQLQMLCDRKLSKSASVPEAIGETFKYANEGIRNFNYAKGINPGSVNYLERDYYGCVGVIAELIGQTLYYGYIGDCGLIVYRSSLLPILVTQNDLVILERFRDMWNFGSEAVRKFFWRANIRNKPDVRYMTYGVINGEEEALSYVKTGVIELFVGDTAILFSDGILPFIFNSLFRETVRDILRDDRLSDDAGQSMVQECLKKITPIAKQHNLDNLHDDKAFIAIQLVE